MLSKLRKQNSEGFTIIEVMIVLAIAALILLIVLLAIPALQRNSRNTQRKNDVSALLSTYSTYLSDNNGSIPASCNITTGGCWLQQAKLGFYDNSSATAVTWTKQASATAPGNVPNTDTVRLYSFSKCAATSTTTAQGTATSSTTNATSRSIIALYAIEGNGNTTYVCQES